MACLNNELMEIALNPVKNKYLTYYDNENYMNIFN